MISMIAATSINGIIGIRGTNKLLWNSKVDIKMFKDQTKGHTVVMGNHTFKSLSNPLAGRKNIVLSKTEVPGERNGAYYYNNIGEILENYPSFIVIGGETIFNLFLPVADEIMITTISLDIEGDDNYAYFPLDKMEQEYFMISESEMVKDEDTVSGYPISLIFTRWHRGIPNIH